VKCLYCLHSGPLTLFNRSYHTSRSDSSLFVRIDRRISYALTIFFVLARQPIWPNSHLSFQMHLVNTKDLIEKCKSGNRKAQQLLFEKLNIPMMGVCLRYLNTREDAEEVLLEGFYKMFRALKKLNYVNEVAFFGWVKKIMINESLMQLRKNKEVQLLSINEEIDMKIDVSPLDKLQANDLLAIIKRIPIGYRTVFNLYEVEGYSHKEIGSELSISIGTSKSQLHKAKKLLKEILEEKNSGYGT